MSGPSPATRSPWAAALLSLFCTGLGHLHAGRPVTGLALFLASLLFVPLALLAAYQTPSTAVLGGLLVAAVGVVVLYLVGVVGAFLAARAPRPTPFDHAGLYLLFALVGVSYPVAGVALLRAHAFAAYQYVERSMNPTLQDGDRILV